MTPLFTKGVLARQVSTALPSVSSPTKNAQGERDPERHQTKKGSQWHFGMKAHIGVDAESGLVHTVIGTAANVNDVTQATQLLHGQEQDVFADAGDQGVDKRPEAKDLKVNWHIAMRPGKRAALERGFADLLAPRFRSQRCSRVARAPL